MCDDGPAWRRQDVFRPDRLARAALARVPVPAVGEVLHQEQAAAGVAEVRGRRYDRYAFGAGVGDLDPYGRGVAGQREVEVAAGDPAVPDGVDGELGDDQRQRVVRVAVVGDAPRVEPLPGKTPGEPRAARCGAEAHREVACGTGGLGDVVGDSGLTVHAPNALGGGVA